MKQHICFRDVTVSYGAHVALQDITLEMPRHQIFGIIGPANSGKTTLLKCINRTIDFVGTSKVRGLVQVNDQDVNRLRNVYDLRRRLGMVFPLAEFIEHDPPVPALFENAAISSRLLT